MTTNTAHSTNAFLGLTGVSAMGTFLGAARYRVNVRSFVRRDVHADTQIQSEQWWIGLHRQSQPRSDPDQLSHQASPHSPPTHIQYLISVQTQTEISIAAISL